MPVTAALLTLVLALHILALGRYFPPSTWFSREPFYTNSYPFHFARGLLQANSIRSHGRLWSYSPALMAGYPAGTRTEPVGAAVGPWLVATRWLHPAVAYKFLVLGLLATAPLATAAAAWWLELDPTACLLAAILGAMGVFSAPGIAMLRAGMFAFLSACYLCLALSAFVYRCARRGGAGNFCALAIAGGALTYLHSLTPLLLAVPAAAGVLALRRQPRRLAAMLAAFAAIFIIALGWLGPILLTLGLGARFSNWWHTPRALAPAVKELFSARLGFPPVIVLALMLYGIIRIRLAPPFRAALCVTILAFGALAYFGSMVAGTDIVEPGRFEPAFYFFAAPFVAVGACELWRRLGGTRRRLRYPARALAVSAALFYAWIPIFLTDLDLNMHGRIAGQLPAQAAELTHWVAASDPDSRLLVEGGWRMREYQLLLPYFGSDLGLLWAVESGRELIGASPNEGFSSYSFANFANGIAFGRPLGQWSAPAFEAALETYNIGGAILWSEAAKEFFASLPDAHLLEQSAPFELYGLSGTRSFLLGGRAASVRAVADCIELRGAQAGQLVLKYHYFKTLRAAPALPLLPVTAGNGDPIPFIGIVNDLPRDITIYNAGFMGWDHPHCGE